MEESIQDTNPPQSFKPFWYVTAVVFVLLFIYGFTMRMRSPIAPSTSQNVQEQVGSIDLRQEGAAGSFILSSQAARGAARTLDLTVNTAGQSLTDADVVLEYPPDAVSVGKITSTDSEVSVFQKEPAPGVVAVTIVTSFNLKQGKVLGTTPLLKVPVTMKSEGSYPINIVSSYKNLTTKWINAQGTLQVPQLTGTTISLP